MGGEGRVFDLLSVSQQASGPDDMGTQDASSPHPSKWPTCWGQITKHRRIREASVRPRLGPPEVSYGSYLHFTDEQTEVQVHCDRLGNCSANVQSHYYRGWKRSPCPTDVELGHVTCFGRWGLRGHNVDGGLECACSSSISMETRPV